MSVISAIEPQKRRGDRRSIFVDGEFVSGAHEEVIVALGLSVGQIWDPELLGELLKAETARKARESALRLLSYRDRTKSEIRKRLIGSDFPEDVVDEVVSHLSEIGLLDDEKFSRDWVKARSAAKPMGRKRLAWELRSKGVESIMVEDTLEELGEDAEYKLALEAASKKIGKADLTDPAVKNRLGSFLQRRGFGWDVITKVLGKLNPED